MSDQGRAEEQREAEGLEKWAAAGARGERKRREVELSYQMQFRVQKPLAGTSLHTHTP